MSDVKTLPSKTDHSPNPEWSYQDVTASLLQMFPRSLDENVQTHDQLRPQSCLRFGNEVVTRVEHRPPSQRCRNIKLVPLWIRVSESRTLWETVSRED